MGPVNGCSMHHRKCAVSSSDTEWTVGEWTTRTSSLGDAQEDRPGRQASHGAPATTWARDMDGLNTSRRQCLTSATPPRAAAPRRGVLCW
jgi:hypothetical protein